jgi:ethanolamine utilization protein EutA (predicted chaperonin)
MSSRVAVYVELILVKSLNENKKMLNISQQHSVESRERSVMFAVAYLNGEPGYFVTYIDIYIYIITLPEYAASTFRAKFCKTMVLLYQNILRHFPEDNRPTLITAALRTRNSIVFDSILLIDSKPEVFSKQRKSDEYLAFWVRQN